ncbi:UNVERIFIED_CONTAM: hypothetical protein FKN15_021871 [Acipenser sinensis]
MSLVSEFLGQLTLNFGGSEEEKSPTVRPAEDFDADKDAARIETAIKTKGVDEQTIIDILTRRSYSQRRDIAFAYERRTKKVGSWQHFVNFSMKNKIIEGPADIVLKIIHCVLCKVVKGLLDLKGYDYTGDDMISALKGALKGPLESVILGLMKSTAQFDASELKNSMKGNRAEPSGVVDYEKIDQDARDLYDAGVKRKGTDVAMWITIMTERSVPHLQKVFDRYKSYSPYDMKESIKKEVKGDMENAFLTLVQCIENKPLYFASRLNDSMQSKGAKDKLLTRIMVSRCEVDLLKIRTEFKKQYSKSLYQTIAEHTKGDYQRVMLCLCGGDD